jgi:hypothetical protein
MKAGLSDQPGFFLSDGVSNKRAGTHVPASLTNRCIRTKKAELALANSALGVMGRIAGFGYSSQKLKYQ